MDAIKAVKEADTLTGKGLPVSATIRTALSNFKCGVPALVSMTKLEFSKKLKEPVLGIADSVVDALGDALANVIPVTP